MTSHAGLAELVEIRVTHVRPSPGAWCAALLVPLIRVEQRSFRHSPAVRAGDSEEAVVDAAVSVSSREVVHRAARTAVVAGVADRTSSPAVVVVPVVSVVVEVG